MGRWVARESWGTPSPRWRLSTRSLAMMALGWTFLWSTLQSVGARRFLSPGREVIPESTKPLLHHLQQYPLILLLSFLRRRYLHFDQKRLHELEGDDAIFIHACIGFRSVGEIDGMSPLPDVLAASVVQETAQQGYNAKISSIGSGSHSSHLCGTKDQGTPVLEGEAVGPAWLIKFGQADDAARLGDAQVLLEEPGPRCPGHECDEKASIYQDS